uniref:Uncharacterized protein n=1 Tax=Ignisphaera aggregans TaxID=334771 RepID=A0A7C2ZRX0_9CREN
MSGKELTKEIKVYRNSDIEEIVAFIPPCHRHLRLAIVTRDQVVVFHEATIAAVVRAYIEIVSHPVRKAVKYTHKKLDKEERKPGYAEDQLIESGQVEDEILKEWLELLDFKPCTGT